MALPTDSRKRAASEELTPESGPKMPRTSTDSDNAADHDGGSESSKSPGLAERWVTLLDAFLDLLSETDEALTEGLLGVPVVESKLQEPMTKSQQRSVMFREISAHFKKEAREVDEQLREAVLDIADTECAGIKEVTTGTSSPVLVPTFGTSDVYHNEEGNSASPPTEYNAKVQACQETGGMAVISTSQKILDGSKVTPDHKDVEPSMNTADQVKPKKKKKRTRTPGGMERRTVKRQIAVIVKIARFISEIGLEARIMQRRPETTSNS
ncbi:hypothetical protein QCA50_001567 [Cerrena zonata]|uniref:Uncharacterized protein n=1 Tax=Cerrena zonata TaxID=2478898 RepID=A0AAW0GXE4_9APHY